MVQFTLRHLSKYLPQVVLTLARLSSLKFNCYCEILTAIPRRRNYPWFCNSAEVREMLRDRLWRLKRVRIYCTPNAGESIV